MYEHVEPQNSATVVHVAIAYAKTPKGTTFKNCKVNAWRLQETTSKLRVEPGRIYVRQQQELPVVTKERTAYPWFAS